MVAHCAENLDRPLSLKPAVYFVQLHIVRHPHRGLGLCFLYGSAELL